MRKYRLSKDYKRLREYLDNGCEVVCFANYNVDGYIRKEVCLARLTGYAGFRRYEYRAGGMEYVAWNESLVGVQKDYPTFEEMMALHDVEYIDYE